MSDGASLIAAPGRIIAGRYRVEKLLGRGGNGAVFVAEQLATEARVALKLLLPHVLEHDEARRRFELEAKIAARIASEYIVRTLDAGFDSELGLPFLVMELLDGQSLHEAVREQGPFSALDTASCILQIAHGLDKAHGARGKDGRPRPIIHRDLKPENLFLTAREDGERVVKILDFGMAKVASESAVRSGGINGSPMYMAYEQLSGGPITPRTDVWALGLVAFFLLCGRSYWLAASAPRPGIPALFAEILHMRLVAPSSRARALGIPADWPEAFDDWFLRCVHRNADARFETAGQAARVLLDALVGEHASRSFSVPLGTTAHSQGIPGRDLQERRPRTLLRLGLVTGSIASAVLGYASWQSRAGAHVIGAAPSRTPVAAAPRTAHPGAELEPSRPAALDAGEASETLPRPSTLAAPRPREPRELETQNLNVRRRRPLASTSRKDEPGTSAAPPAHILDTPVYSER